MPTFDRKEEAVGKRRILPVTNYHSVTQSGLNSPIPQLFCIRLFSVQITMTTRNRSMCRLAQSATFTMALRGIKLVCLLALLSSVAAERQFEEQHASSMMSSELVLNHHEERADNLLPNILDVSPIDRSGDIKLQWGDNKMKSDKCNTHLNCPECASSSSTCHWCDHDNTCHVVGSPHGCMYGITCSDPVPTPAPEDNTCVGHKTCGNCTISSKLCHWCAHDNSCHSVGSVYGCVSGVSCYSNDQCQRTEPEPIKHIAFQQIELVPVLIIVILASICLGCATMGFCVAGGVKEAFDDLAVAASNAPPRPYPPASRPVQIASPTIEGEALVLANDMLDEDSAEDGTFVLEEEGNATSYSLIEEDESEPLWTQSPAQPSPTRRFNNVRRVYKSCTACYIVTVALVAVFTAGSIRYFPRKPQYGVCSDEVAWKSLIDSITSIGAKPTFEILVSIMNPNRFDVNLINLSGTFKHRDVQVGSFMIPPTQVKSLSITDLMIFATFVPDKWEALSLSKEYYRGNLVLSVDMSFMGRIPALFNYSFNTDLPEMFVDVNKHQSRLYCACPEWNDTKNKTITLL